MATNKRAKRSSSGQPAIRANAERSSAPATPATGPTISVTAQPLPAAPLAESPSAPALAAEMPRQPAAGTRSPDSPAAERAAMARRRTMIIGGASVLGLLVAFLGYRALTPQVPAVPVVVPAATAQPVAAQPAAAQPIAAQPIATTQPIATAQPVVAAQTAATAQPAAPIAATTQPAAAAPGAALTCNTIAGLPLFTGATCIDQDSDHDDGVIKLKNTYAASASADEIRRFYESAFASNGWTLGDFKYDINQGQRRAKIDVDIDQGPAGPVTQVRLTEYLAAAPTTTTCAPIAGLPAFPNAACVKFKIDQDDGIFKAEHTYSTKASPEEVRRFYESALTQNGWVGPDFQYDLQQGLRRLQVDVETKQGAQGSFTEFSIAEK